MNFQGIVLDSGTNLFHIVWAHGLPPSRRVAEAQNSTNQFLASRVKTSASTHLHYMWCTETQFCLVYLSVLSSDTLRSLRKKWNKMATCKAYLLDLLHTAENSNDKILKLLIIYVYSNIHKSGLKKFLRPFAT
jgi:hypothetical protein